PGAANTVGAVGEAWASRSPVVIVATDIPTRLRKTGVYRGVLHECTDQAALFAPITKTTPGSLRSALRDAITPPTRPVYVGIPSDILTNDAPPERTPPELIPRTASVAPLVDALAASRRPLVWAGGGTRDAGDAIDAFARRIGAPVVTTYQARGLLAPDHPLLVPAPPHEPEVTALIERADLAIVAGSDLDQMNTMQWRLPLPERRVAVNIDGADAAKNYPMTAVVESDARVLELTANELEPRETWAGDLGALGTAIRARLAADPATRDAVTFLESTEAALPPDVAVFADMCIAGYWLAGHFRVETRRGLHYPMGWGTLGFAFPAAIGASTVRPTVAVAGDGGALFALGELSALAELGTPCTLVVVDDCGYGMLRYGYTTTAANDLPPVDYAAIARAFGIASASIDGVGSEYAQALARAVASRVPWLLHVRARLHPPATTTPFWPMKSTT
ncbi:MAG TPA: thiamine pyrophosphate-dependent enzyme, partial [Acidimicrobiia bacterium]|nr:thiamine pyrophosphate-dependent enzyme [Acidimicrobiia bacterium]